MQDVTPRGQRRLVGGEQHRAAALGPIIEPDDFMHLACFYCFEDVDAGTAPIRMVPNGRPDHECVPMIVPGGSVCLYSIYTRHAASDFTASSGHRPVMWVGLHAHRNLRQLPPTAQARFALSTGSPVGCIDGQIGGDDGENTVGIARRNRARNHPDLTTPRIKVRRGPDACVRSQRHPDPLLRRDVVVRPGQDREYRSRRRCDRRRGLR